MRSSSREMTSAGDHQGQAATEVARPGARYRAKTRLSAKDNTTLADSGETCDRVNPESLPWLLEQGLIEAVE